MDIANVPTEWGKINIVKVKAVVTVGGRNFSPLPWLGESGNAAKLEPAVWQTILLAAGDDAPMGAWYFVLNHREGYSQPAGPSKMDWTNMAPIPFLT